MGDEMQGARNEEKMIASKYITMSLEVHLSCYPPKLGSGFPSYV